MAKTYFLRDFCNKYGMYLSSPWQITYLLARQAESDALEIHSTAMIEFFSHHLCREQTDSSLQVSFTLLVALLQELKGPLSLKAP